MNLSTLKKELQRIKKLGFVATHRTGDTGIGKTLEDLLNIKENNIPLHDISGVAELKAYRKNAKSMLTLFTLEPLLRAATETECCLIILDIQDEKMNAPKNYTPLFPANDIITSRLNLLFPKIRFGFKEKVKD